MSNRAEILKAQRESEAAIAGMKPEARKAFVFWYRAQIEELRQDALDNAAEDRKQAKDERQEDADVLLRAADTAEHYAEQLQRILDGDTWDERFAEKVRAAPTPRRRNRR